MRLDLPLIIDKEEGLGQFGTSQQSNVLYIYISCDQEH